jgi:hypothetical protein
VSAAELQHLWAQLERARLEHERKEEALFTELRVDLADLSATQFKSYPTGQAFGLVFLDGLGAQLELQGRGIGNVPVFRLGSAISGYFEEVQIRRVAGSPSSGIVTLLVLLSPFAGHQRSPTFGTTQRVSYTATYNGTDNAPTNGTPAGINLEGAKGLRARVVAPVTQTLIDGDLWLWIYDNTLLGTETAALWGQRVTKLGQLSDAAGQRVWQSDDFPVPVGADWAFLEVRNGTHSGGAGAFTVVLTARG